MGGRIAVVALACAGTGCIVAKQSLKMPNNEQTTVALMSGTLGHPMNGIARHPWFAVRKQGETSWRLYEVGGGGSEEDPTKNSPYGDTIVHKVWRGKEADRAAACIEKVGPQVKRQIERDYFFYPGPNSNTFGDVVLRRCKLSGALPSTSVGKDWRGLFGAGITSERTGIQVETPLVGFKVGLKEGVEVHLLGLSIGIDLWPPALILPIGPGRLGFADR
ncbi:MAG: DUF3750 domain-containing protein [Deltaproteobacteria bacterium]|nr:DUF3750 domain-containing protein [Deltaproteobacteria bacterium]MCW5805308.1 DUF3750 domain-containing protein [Deltaproteobacteria bacterium]